MATAVFKRRAIAALLIAGMASLAFGAQAQTTTASLGPGTLTSSPQTYASEAFAADYNPQGNIVFNGGGLVYSLPASGVSTLLPIGDFTFTYTVLLQGCNMANPTAGLVFSDPPELIATAPLSDSNGGILHILPQAGGGSGNCYASFLIKVADTPSLLTVETGGTLTLNAATAQGAGALSSPGNLLISAEITNSSLGLIPSLDSPSSSNNVSPSTVVFQTSAHQLVFTTQAMSAPIGDAAGGTSSAVIDLFSRHSNGYTWSQPNSAAPGTSEAFVDIGNVVITNNNYLDATAGNPYDPYAQNDGSVANGSVSGYGTVEIATSSASAEVNGSTGLYETALVQNLGGGGVTPCPASHTGLVDTDYPGSIGGTGVFTYSNVPFPQAEQSGQTPYTPTSVQYEVCHYGLADDPGSTPVVLGDVNGYATTVFSDNAVTAVAAGSAASLIPYAYNGTVSKFEYSFSDPTYVEYLRVVNNNNYGLANVACNVYNDTDGTVGYAVLWNESGNPSNPAPTDGGSQAAYPSLQPHAGTLIPISSVFADAGLGTPGNAADANNPYLRGNMVCFAPFGVTLTQLVSTGSTISDIK